MASSSESPSVRVSPKSQLILRNLAKAKGKPIQTILDEAIDHYQRESFLDETNAAFVKLREDREQWEQELAERRLWEAALLDGLDEE
jgi:hypothetical protein